MKTGLVDGADEAVDDLLVTRLIVDPLAGLGVVVLALVVAAVAPGVPTGGDPHVLDGVEVLTSVTRAPTLRVVAVYTRVYRSALLDGLLADAQFAEEDPLEGPREQEKDESGEEADVEGRADTLLVRAFEREEVLQVEGGIGGVEEVTPGHRGADPPAGGDGDDDGDANEDSACGVHSLNSPDGWSLNCRDNITNIYECQ